MIKNTVIALLTAATLVGVAAPAFAESGGGQSDFNEEDNSSAYNTAAQNILSRLRDQGVNATSVEQWGGLVRAFVVQEDGRQVMQFFAPGSLQQVAL